METTKGHGLACTVAWTQLAQAMRNDGMSVGDTCPPHITAFIREVVSAAFASDTGERGVAEAWDEGYRMGVNDERISEANIGIAGFNAKVEPARENPYRRAALRAQPAGGGVCGCGRVADYEANDGGRCCNKYGVRCTPPESGGQAGAETRTEAHAYALSIAGAAHDSDEDAAARAFAERVGEDWDKMTETARDTARRMAGEAK